MSDRVAYRSAFRGKRTSAKPVPSVADVPSPVSAMTHMSAHDQAEALRGKNKRRA